MKTNYAITLKLVGEVKRLDNDAADCDAIDVASIRRDYGKVAEAFCGRADLEKMTPCNAVIALNVNDVLPDIIIDMLHLARDMQNGKFRGEAFAEAVKSGALSGGSLRGEVAADVLRQLDQMGLSAIAPMVSSSKVN